MIEIPPDVVAGWPAPNYANAETKGAALPTIVILFYALAAFALGVRLYDKIKISRRFFAEDYLIILTMVSLALLSLNQLTCLTYYSRFRLRWSQLLCCCPNGNTSSTDIHGMYLHSIPDQEISSVLSILFVSVWHQHLFGYRFLPSTGASSPIQNHGFTRTSFTLQCLSPLGWQ